MHGGIITKFTFESMYGRATDWITSSQRFDNVNDATKAACEWLLICAENNYVNTVVRVKQVNELG